mgnify:CR=1 FL=1
MTCKGTRRTLSAYIDGVVDPRTRAAIDAHIAACPRCADELARLTRYRARMAALPRLSAPEGFAETVRTRIAAGALPQPETTSIVTKIVRTVTSAPLRIPITAVGAFSVVIIIAIFFQRSSDIAPPPLTEKRYFGMQQQSQDTTDLARMRDDAAPSDTATDALEPMRSKSDSPRFGRKQKTAKPGIVADRPIEILLAIADTRSMPADDEIGAGDMATMREAEEKAPEAPAALKSESRDTKMALSRKRAADGMARGSSIERSKDAPARPALRDSGTAIRSITSDVRGRVIAEERDPDTRMLRAITIDVPAAKYGTFVERLAGVGRISMPPKREGPHGRDWVRIRIRTQRAPHSR